MLIVMGDNCNYYQIDAVSDITFVLQLQDRFATIAYILPPIDESQDWTLIGSSQVNEYTILEVVRDLVTCDKKDLPIKVQTGTLCHT